MGLLRAGRRFGEGERLLAFRRGEGERGRRYGEGERRFGEAALRLSLDLDLERRYFFSTSRTARLLRSGVRLELFAFGLISSSANL